MKTQGEGQFFVKLWLDDSLRTMAEVKGAFKLLFWYVGRITIEYVTEFGIRCGGVHGSNPVTDFDIARAITGSGAACNGDQVYRWRRTLAGYGYIAYKRTPAGQRVFVIGSDKFPENKLEQLPKWATDIVSRALLLRAEHSAKTAEEMRRFAESFRENHGAFRENCGAFRENCGNNKEKEFEREVEKEVGNTAMFSATQQKGPPEGTAGALSHFDRLLVERYGPGILSKPEDDGALRG